MKGNGKGQFFPLQPASSGFAVQGDGKSLIKLNRQNKCLFLAACNSGPLKAYDKKQTKGNVPLLKNEVYVIYTFNNGKIRKEEFYYGSSYLSQSGRFIERNSNVKRIELFSLKKRLRAF